MPYGIYLSASGADVQSKRMEVLANNLANVDSPGFKRELAVAQARFAEGISQGHASASTRGLDNVGGGVMVRETVTDFSQGTLKQTYLPTDLAIEGEGYFLIDRDGEQLLTRAGNFMFTNEGRLVTPQGYSVLGEDRLPLFIDPTLPWTLSPDGMMQQGGEVYPLALVKPRSLGDLARAGNNAFKPLARFSPLEPEERRVRSGFLELSAVKPTREMMDMIDSSRMFEANMRMVQHHDMITGALVTRALRTT